VLQKTQENTKKREKTRKNYMVDVQQMLCKKRYYGATPSFLSLWYRRYHTDGTDTLVLYHRDRPKGRFGTVGLGGWLVRLYGQLTL
jgi:hypothetical protein